MSNTCHPDRSRPAFLLFCFAPTEVVGLWSGGIVSSLNLGLIISGLKIMSTFIDVLDVSSAFRRKIYSSEHTYTDCLPAHTSSSTLDIEFRTVVGAPTSYVALEY
jgi:hypothetical protein